MAGVLYIGATDLNGNLSQAQAGGWVGSAGGGGGGGGRRAVYILYYLHIPGDSIRDLFIPKRSQRIARYISLTVIFFEDLELLRVRKLQTQRNKSNKWEVAVCCSYVWKGSLYIIWLIIKYRSIRIGFLLAMQNVLITSHHWTCRWFQKKTQGYVVLGRGGKSDWKYWMIHGKKWSCHNTMGHFFILGVFYKQYVKWWDVISTFFIASSKPILPKRIRPFRTYLEPFILCDLAFFSPKPTKIDKIPHDIFHDPTKRSALPLHQCQEPLAFLCYDDIIIKKFPENERTVLLNCLIPV